MNVLSETALSRALETMKRDPRTVNVNREIGAELAIREGASALLLPSIAEVGGRLRFTIEVIDPASQATVFSVARDASDSSAIVDKIDESLAELRGSLGESINAIADTHTPLSSAATANLDALKAYSIGVSELVRGRPDEALAFYRQALRLDANFTMARIGLSDALRDLNRRDEALAELRTANDAAEDLLERERLHLDAKLASLAGKPEEALSHWGVLSRLYPDFYPGQGGLAWYAWTFALDNNTALDAARAGSVTTNPHRGAAVYLRGILQLSLNQADSALASFEEAASLGSGFSRHFHSAAYASKLRFDEAEHVLSLGRDDGTASTQLGDLRHRVLLALDQGEFSSARRYTIAGSEIFNNASLRAGQMWANQQISVSFLMDDDATFEKNVRQKIESELARQSSSADPEATADRLRGLLLTGILCTFRNCNPESISRLWATLETEASNSAFLDVRLLTGFLRMELEVDRALLRDQIHNFSKETTRRQAIWIDLALARAYLREGQTDRAIDLFESLPRKRGLAWTEMRGDFAMQTFCVLATSLSYLDLSQALHSDGKTERARDALNQFVGRWPAFGESDFLAERVRMISEPLQTDPGQGSETSANPIEHPVSQGPQ